MAEKTQDFGVIEFDAPVTEMATDAGAIVQLDPARVKTLLDATGDTTPEFPVLRVEGGTSRNGNHWTPEVLRDVAEQINKEEPVGYLGHIKPEDDGYAFPRPQTIWLKAKTQTEGDKEVLYVKGYNFPDAEIRSYLKTGVTKSASWRGKAAGPVIAGVRHIKAFALESFDWSRKGKQGMNVNVVAIASEMDEGSEKDVDLTKVKMSELEEANPSLVDLIKREGAKDAEKTISEMEPLKQEAEDSRTVFAKLREVLHIDENADVVEAVTEIAEKVDNASKATLKEKIATLLEGKVKSESARKTVMRLIPVSEMEGASDEELEKKIDKLFDEDEEIKAVVTEMEGAPAPLSHKGNQDDKSKVGGSGMVRESVVRV